MNQIFAGAATFLVVLVLWGLGRRPNKKILTNTDASYVADINRPKITLLQSLKDENSFEFASSGQSENVWESPKSPRDKANLQLKLRQLMAAGPEERLKAIEICVQWGDKSILPFLLRGLKDSDSRVVATSALGIQQQKNNIPLDQEKRPPRNVALMR